MKKLNYNPVSAVIKKLKTIHGDPMKVCYGFAFGIFMSTTPLIGLKWFVAFPIVCLAKWNKMACMIGVLQVNYLTGPLFYALAFLIGKNVCGYPTTFELPDRMSFSAIKDLLTGNADVFVSLAVGGLILSIPLTIGAFYLAKSFLSKNLKTQLA